MKRFRSVLVMAIVFASLFALSSVALAENGPIVESYARIGR